MLKIATVVGARPQFIKAAAVSRAIESHNGSAVRNAGRIKEIIIHTGQHYDHNMSDVFFEEMHICKPDHFLNVNDLSHGAMTGRMLEKIEKVLKDESPQIVLVYGDTNTTLAAALSAVKLHIPVAHVEAGLRSFNRLMPEEINRVVTDHVANVLFCPTRQAVENLKTEGFAELSLEAYITSNSLKDLNRKAPHRNLQSSTHQLIRSGPCVARVGDVMYDAALYYGQYEREPDLDLPKRFVLATLHRAENTDNPERLGSIIRALEKISLEIPIILPLHPRTRKLMQSNGISISARNLNLTDPVSYLIMVYLLERCTLVMTDSGGLQKEAFFFKKPCLTLRDETEWVELVEHGFNCLTGADTDRICDAFESMIESSLDFDINFYGDGTASEQIVNILAGCL